MELAADSRESTRLSALAQWTNVASNVAVVVLAGCVLWMLLIQDRGAPAPIRQAAEPPLPAELISSAGSATLGSASAPLTLLAFSDFECPFCARFAADTFPLIKREYIDTGQIQFVFRHLPLEDIHPHATKLAIASECAGSQGQFWRMHDRLFLNRASGAIVALNSFTAGLPLDARSFEDCLARQAPLALVNKDRALAQRLAITGTPTFLVGRGNADHGVRVLKRLSGARPIAEFRTAFDELLSETPR
jgi:protein-disulfide isomerase